MQEKNLTEILPYLSPTCSNKMIEVREAAGLSRDQCYGDAWSYETVRMCETGRTHPSIMMLDFLADRCQWDRSEWYLSGLHKALLVQRPFVIEAVKRYLNLPRKNQMNVLRLIKDYSFHSIDEAATVFQIDPHLHCDPLAWWFLSWCGTHSGVE
jgi:hypothetical protein